MSWAECLHVVTMTTTRWAHIWPGGFHLQVSLDSFTVSLHSTVQWDYQWCLKNNENSHRVHSPLYIIAYPEFHASGSANHTAINLEAMSYIPLRVCQQPSWLGLCSSLSYPAANLFPWHSEASYKVTRYREKMFETVASKSKLLSRTFFFSSFI